MNIDTVDAAEKEASEVLHSLLSVERIEKPEHRLHGHTHQVVVVDSKEESNLDNSVERQQWTNQIQQSVFNNYQNNDWAHTLTLEINQALTQDETLQLLSKDVNTQERNYESTVTNNKSSSDDNQNQSNKKNKKCVKKTIRKKYKKDMTIEKGEQNLDDIEDSAYEVRARFQLGCECQDVCCFKGLNAENVYKHRLNIAELTKEEHDMYLMGVTMACMADPGVTAKQRKRTRLRAQYVYMGRRVCLSAFLYLENCTLYQLKRIRKHVMTHGVAPRVHGNHGKKPHNVFPLDTYRRATEFLKSYIEKFNIGSSNLKSPIQFPSEISRKTIHNLYKQTISESGPSGSKVMGYSTFRHFMKEQFPQVRFCKQDSGLINTSSTTSNSNSKHVTTSNSNNNNNTNTVVVQQQHQLQEQQTQPQLQQQHQQQQPQHIITTCINSNHNHDHNANNINEQQSINVQSQTTPNNNNSSLSNNLTHSACPVSVSNGGTILSSTQMATIPVIFSESTKPELTQQQTAFIVTPVSQLVQPFQAGHAITVTPITNTAYAFATL